MKGRRKARHDDDARRAAARRRTRTRTESSPTDDDASEPVDCADTVDELHLQIARTVKGYDE